MRRERSLLDAFRGERRVAMATDEVERLAVDVRRRLTVADQQDLRGARRRRDRDWGNLRFSLTVRT